MNIIKSGLMLLILLSTIVCYGQSEIYSFQLIEKPIETIYLDSLIDEADTLTTITIPNGDSIRIEGFCFIADTVDIHTLYFNVGNETSVESYNIYSDSVFYSLLPYTAPTVEVNRSGQFIHIEFGSTLKTDTLYGTCRIKGINNDFSVVKPYPNTFEF